MTHTFDAEFWDRMYERHQPSGSREPNPLLTEHAASLPPGAALDVGCGEGADAIWLAKQGWNVTAVDISRVALDRARAVDTAGAVTWREADVLAWEPPADSFDLVAVHFLHVPPDARTRLFERLARAVRVGGTLLVVAHHHSDLHTTIGRPPIADLFFTAEEVGASLAPDRWDRVVHGTRPRVAADREGRRITIQDMVLVARRLG